MESNASLHPVVIWAADRARGAGPRRPANKKDGGNCLGWDVNAMQGGAEGQAIVPQSLGTMVWARLCEVATSADSPTGLSGATRVHGRWNCSMGPRSPEP